MITSVVYSEAEAIRLCATINEYTKPKMVASFHEGHSIDDLGQDGGPVFNVTIDLTYIEWPLAKELIRDIFKAPTLSPDPE